MEQEQQESSKNKYYIQEKKRFPCRMSLRLTANEHELLTKASECLNLSNAEFIRLTLPSICQIVCLKKKLIDMIGLNTLV